MTMIDLPDPKFQPIRDMVLAKRLTETASGLVVLPDAAEDRSQVCRVLAVGPGLMLDSGAIRPAPCQRGDKIFTTPRDGYEVTLDGEKYAVFEAMEIVGIFLDESVRAYGDETC